MIHGAANGGPAAILIPLPNDEATARDAKGNRGHPFLKQPPLPRRNPLGQDSDPRMEVTAYELGVAVDRIRGKRKALRPDIMRSLAWELIHSQKLKWLPPVSPGF